MSDVRAVWISEANVLVVSPDEHADAKKVPKHEPLCRMKNQQQRVLTRIAPHMQHGTFPRVTNSYAQFRWEPKPYAEPKHLYIYVYIYGIEDLLNKFGYLIGSELLESLVRFKKDT